MTQKLFLIFIFGLGSGIIGRSLFTLSWPVIIFVSLLGALFMCGYLFKRRQTYAIAACFLLAAAFGAGRMVIAPNDIAPGFAPFIGSSVELDGVIVEDPDIRDSNQHVTIEVKQGNETTRILAFAPLYPEFSYGEQVHLSGKLKRPEPFATDGGREFAYDAYLAKDGIFSIVSSATLTKTEEPEGVWTAVQGFLYSIKHAFIDALNRALPQPYAGLAVGINAGGKQGLDQSLIDAFTIAGLLPIIVLSGYNVMIVAEGVMRGLAFLPKRIAIILATLTVAAFVLAAGGGSSALRAGLMAGLALFARGTGRIYDALRALGLVFVIMLLINPLLLLNDVGFQFSFAATLGLIIGTPLLEARLQWIKSGFLREIVATTTAAQAAVLPLLLYQTGNLSLVSVFANVLVLPFVPLTMLLSFVASLISLAIPFLAPYAGFPAFLFLSYMVGVAHLASSLPFAHVIIYAFPFWIVIGLYLILAYLVFEFKKTTVPLKVSLQPSSNSR